MTALFLLSIWNIGSPSATTESDKFSTPEKPTSDNESHNIKKLRNRLASYESHEKKRQEYTQQVSQMVESLKEENAGLNTVIEKMKLEYERVS